MTRPRSRLGEADWPAADRAMWSALMARGSPLDEAGALAHLRAASVESFAKSYGTWLGWLARVEPGALSEAPVPRASAVRLRRWAGDMAALSPVTRLIRIGHLLRLLTAFAPGADWQAQSRVLSLARREARDTPRTRKAGRIVSSVELFEAGLNLVEASGGMAAPPASLAEARGRRDGMMVAFLALVPIRRRAFLELALGRSLLVQPEGLGIVLDDAMTKTGTWWETELPALLAQPLRHYLVAVRPWLMARTGARHDRVWVNNKGRPWSEPHLGAHIPRLTERLLGRKLSIHLFRDAAATTLADLSPEAGRLTRAILGHAGFATAERHYNHARMIDAGRRYSTVIERLTEDAP